MLAYATTQSGSLFSSVEQNGLQNLQHSGCAGWLFPSPCAVVASPGNCLYCVLYWHSLVCKITARGRGHRHWYLE